jgi:hypothetical protein
VVGDEYLEREMARVSEELEEVRMREQTLLRERLALWQTATERGWSQSRMSEASTATVGTIQQALHKSRRRVAAQS